MCVRYPSGYTLERPPGHPGDELRHQIQLTGQYDCEEEDDVDRGHYAGHITQVVFGFSTEFHFHSSEDGRSRFIQCLRLGSFPFLRRSKSL